jgi:hypothetical protein
MHAGAVSSASVLVETPAMPDAADSARAADQFQITLESRHDLARLVYVPLSRNRSEVSATARIAAPLTHSIEFEGNTLRVRFLPPDRALNYWLLYRDAGNAITMRIQPSLDSGVGEVVREVALKATSSPLYYESALVCSLFETVSGSIRTVLPAEQNEVTFARLGDFGAISSPYPWQIGGTFVDPTWEPISSERWQEELDLIHGPGGRHKGASGSLANLVVRSRTLDADYLVYHEYTSRKVAGDRPAGD